MHPNFRLKLSTRHRVATVTHQDQGISPSLKLTANPWHYKMPQKILSAIPCPSDAISQAYWLLFPVPGEGVKCHHYTCCKSEKFIILKHVK